MCKCQFSKMYYLIVNYSWIFFLQQLRPWFWPWGWSPWPWPWKLWPWPWGLCPCLGLGGYVLVNITGFNFRLSLPIQFNNQLSWMFVIRRWNNSVNQLWPRPLPLWRSRPLPLCLLLAQPRVSWHVLSVSWMRERERSSPHKDGLYIIVYKFVTSLVKFLYNLFVTQSILCTLQVLGHFYLRQRSRYMRLTVFVCLSVC